MRLLASQHCGGGRPDAAGAISTTVQVATPTSRVLNAMLNIQATVSLCHANWTPFRFSQWRPCGSYQEKLKLQTVLSKRATSQQMQSSCSCREQVARTLHG